MKLVLKNLKGNYKQVVLGPLFKLFEAVLELLVPFVMAKIIDVGIKNADINYIFKGGTVLVVLGALGFGAAMLCQYYAAVAGGRFGKSLRTQLFSHVLSLSAEDCARFGTGGLITRLTNDVNHVQNGLNMTIRLGARGPFLLIGSLVMAFIVNAKIALIFLVSTPLVLLVIILVMRKTLPAYTEIQNGQDRLLGLAGENLGGARVIRAFSRQEHEKQGFNAAAEKLNSALIRAGKFSAALNPLTGSIINIAIIAIVWLGASFANTGLIANGEIIALVSYMTQSLLALTVAANLTVLFTRAIASAKRIEAVLETEPKIKSGAGAKEDKNAAALCFNDVSFAYYKDADNALKSISFCIPKGTTLGIIGGTGSGKSTLVQLLCRFYDADSGNILINGANVKDYDLSTLRNKIGLVPQKSALISGSIRRNMLLGKINADDEEIWQALEVAQAAEFVRQKDGGLDFMVEESGKNLSGGQRQRLCIARAVLQKAEILVLDDSSSALDYATDAALRTALALNMPKNSSTIIISQRAAGIKHADNILVLDNGKIVNSGTHQSLLEESEIYREICASQGLYSPPAKEENA